MVITALRELLGFLGKPSDANSQVVDWLGCKGRVDERQAQKASSAGSALLLQLDMVLSEIETVACPTRSQRRHPPLARPLLLLGECGFVSGRGAVRGSRADLAVAASSHGPSLLSLAKLQWKAAAPSCDNVLPMAASKSTEPETAQDKSFFLKAVSTCGNVFVVVLAKSDSVCYGHSHDICMDEI